MVLDPTDRLRVRGVLDWEMATVGDPLMDLGGALAYWIQADDDDVLPGVPPSADDRARDVDARARSCSWYAERTGLEVGARAVALLRGVRAVPARRDLPADLVPLRPRADPQRGLRRASARPWPTSSRGAGAGLDGSTGSGGRLMGLVLLVRHGQASFGADDYDVLSETGVAQSKRLGAWLAEADLQPDRAAARRHAAAARHRDRDGRGRRLVGRSRARRGVERVRPPRGGGARARRPRGRRGSDRSLGPPRLPAASSRTRPRAGPAASTTHEYDESWPAFVARARARSTAPCARRRGHGRGLLRRPDRRSRVRRLVDPAATAAPSCRGCGARSTPSAPTPRVTRVITGSTGRRLLTFNEHSPPRRATWSPTAEGLPAVAQRMPSTERGGVRQRTVGPRVGEHSSVFHDRHPRCGRVPPLRLDRPSARAAPAHQRPGRREVAWLLAQRGARAGLALLAQ